MSGGQKVLWSDSDVLDVLWRFEVKGQTASQLALTYGVTRNAILGLVHRVKRDLPPGREDALTDEQLLVILDKVRGAGRPADEIGHEVGLSRNAVLALVHRLMAEVAGPGAAVKPENRNGGMDRHWFLDGLQKQGIAA
jgi:hypothetical protein